MGATDAKSLMCRCRVRQQARKDITGGGTMIALLRGAMFSLVLLASLAAGTAPSSAADYPNRPVHWMIGFAAGGPVDLVARIMSQWLSEHFGQQFVVENRSGVGGNLAAAAGVNSPPDRHTPFFPRADHSTNPPPYQKL